MNWDNIDICELDRIDSIRAIIQVLNLLERDIDSRRNKNVIDSLAYRIIYQYLKEARGDFYAALEEDEYRERFDYLQNYLKVVNKE